MTCSQLPAVSSAEQPPLNANAEGAAPPIARLVLAVLQESQSVAASGERLVVLAAC